MQFRPFGDTGRVLSCLGLDISDNIVSQDQYNAIVARAVNRGLNHVLFHWHILDKELDYSSALKTDSALDISLLAPADPRKLKKTVYKALEKLDIQALDFLVIESHNSLLLNNVLTSLMNEGTVRHIVFSVSEEVENLEDLIFQDFYEGVSFSGEGVLNLLHFASAEKIGVQVFNIFSGNPDTADSSLRFLNKALSLSDINIIHHRFNTPEEVDLIVDYIDDEAVDHEGLTKEELTERLEALKEQALIEKKSIIQKVLESFSRQECRQ